MSKTVEAFAKINLGLRILGQRPDGYHEIETLFQSIDLHDTLTIERMQEQKISLEIKSPWVLPNGRTNLVYRAAEAVLAHAGVRAGVRVSLTKRIPVGAGLGGGSSDAAATLVGVNELFGLGLSDEQLEVLARQLGSDVPYFLRGGLCRGRGRGEILERLPSRWEEQMFLLVQPDCALSTEEVYREHDRLLAQGWRPPVARLWDGMDCANDLEDAAIRLCPMLRELRQAVQALHPDVWGMSGSGPTYYAVWSLPAQAEHAVQVLTQKGYTVYCVHPTPKGYELAKET